MALTIDMKGKVVLVTGVTSGIGAGVAKRFFEAGADVAGCGIEPVSNNGAAEFNRIAEEKGCRSLYFSTDITDENDVQKMVKATIDRFGKIDAVVSNAGANIFEGAAGCDEKQWTRNMNLNAASHWRLAKYCKPYLEKANPGVIIIMSSNHAFATLPGCFPYNVAKAALVAIVRSLSIEWGPEIRTVGIAPGFIDTPGNEKWFNSFPAPAKEKQRTLALHPVKKLGTPEEVGAWCVFLASPYAAFASGTTYVVDGGRSALLQDRSF